MSIKKIPANVPNGRLDLTSSWKARESFVYIEDKSHGYKKMVFESGPTTSTGRITFPYSLPSGAVIHSAKIWATSSNPPSGCSTRAVNGKGFNESRGAEIGAPVTLTTPSGTLEAVFTYKTNAHVATLVLSNIYLEIDYDGEAIDTPESEEAASNPGELAPPPTGVCIYDPSDGAIYTFDGVVKINHALSMDLQEEPEGEKKAKYVNNAKNEPDKLTIDVMMSDVYTGGTLLDMGGYMSAQQSSALDAARNAVTTQGFTRSAVFFHALHWLKEQRRKLAVITPQYVHVDMIIASVTVSQDENSPFGWEGQIGFQHAFEPKEVKKKVTKKGGTTTEPTPDVTVTSRAVNNMVNSAGATNKKSGSGG